MIMITRRLVTHHAIHNTQAVRAAIEAHLRYAPTKTSKSRIKRLRGMSRPQYRLRVDDIRVYDDVLENTIEIIAIIPKSEAADWLAREGKKP